MSTAKILLLCATAVVIAGGFILNMRWDQITRPDVPTEVCWEYYDHDADKEKMCLENPARGEK